MISPRIVIFHFDRSLSPQLWSLCKKYETFKGKSYASTPFKHCLELAKNWSYFGDSNERIEHERAALWGGQEKVYQTTRFCFENAREVFSKHILMVAVTSLGQIWVWLGFKNFLPKEVSSEMEIKSVQRFYALFQGSECSTFSYVCLFYLIWAKSAS